jgi:CBS domain-containing protein
MKVKDVMTVDPITVGPDLPFKEVVDRLIEHGIGGLPVVDSDGGLVGIVTETDLITKEAYGDEPRGALSVVGAVLAGKHHAWLKKASGLTAGEIMTRHVVTIAPSEDLQAAARLCLEHKVGRLPVVEDGRLVGIISRRDLLRPFHRTDQEISADVQALLDDPMYSDSRYGDVSFAIDEGVVTLTGTASFPSEVTLIRDIVAHVPGVIRVENEVTAREPEPRLAPPPEMH